LPIPTSSPVRFGSFELDLQTGELRKNGIKIRLADQPLQVLTLLLEHPGEVVTREELQRRLWSSDTFVEFEHSLNAAVKRLREALGDSAENPKFVETLPRHGYRLIAPVGSTARPPVEPLVRDARETVPLPKRRRWAVVTALLVLGAASYPVVKWMWHWLHPEAPIQTIAILPLENLSHDPDEEYFSDGMTEALITELGQIRAVRVISRQSVMHYKGTTKTIPQIGEELKVDGLVEGSALRDGNKVRISVQLIRVKPEEHLWAHSYERDLGDVLALQGDVASAIASEIIVTLTPRARVLQKGPARQQVEANPLNEQSYELYLKGRYHWNKRTPNGIMRSLEYFESAAERDPTNSLVYAGIADSYIVLGSGQFGLMSPKEAMLKAEEAAKHALQLNSGLAEAHTTLGYLRFYFDWDPQGAEREFQEAIELNPSYATAHHWYALSLNAMGRFPEAIREIKKAERLDPLSLIITSDMGTVLHYARQDDQAIEQLRKALEMDPRFATAHYVLARCYTQEKRYQEAIAEIKRAIELAGDEPLWNEALAYIYAMAGYRDEAMATLSKLNEQSKHRFIPASNLTWAYIGLGDTDRAFFWLEKAYAAREDIIVVLKVQPELDPLRLDPRFKALLQRMNFSP
jgi:TolB-like protein/DNA-binding winged helix-turn-helix (wHTH) protein/Flp pilus assembly protein TadD